MKNKKRNIRAEPGGSYFYIKLRGATPEKGSRVETIISSCISATVTLPGVPDPVITASRKKHEH